MDENDKPSASNAIKGRVAPQSEAVLVYTTFPTLQVAESAGRSLITGRLAGCINILPAMVSLYLWEGKLERADEVVLIAKTASDRADACMAAIVAAHPYETPAVLALPVAAGNAAYLDWIVSGTRVG
ncbi:MAG: divalent-cation tolerance protein CutA [Hyphomicrobiaceae bacterium]